MYKVMCELSMMLDNNEYTQHKYIHPTNLAILTTLHLSKFVSVETMLALKVGRNEDIVDVPVVS